MSHQPSTLRPRQTTRRGSRPPGRKGGRHALKKERKPFFGGFRGSRGGHSDEVISSGSDDDDGGGGGGEKSGEDDVAPEAKKEDDEKTLRATVARKWNISRNRRFLLLTLPILGANLLNSVHSAYGPPNLRRLGAPEGLATVSLFAGPVSGLVIQPVVGILSDKNTSPKGRRNIYIKLATIWGAILMMLLGWTEKAVNLVAKVLPMSASTATTVSLYIGVLVFFSLMIFVNMLASMARALSGDCAGKQLQAPVFAFASKVETAGALVGFGLGFADLDTLGKQLGGLNQIEMLSLASTVILLLCVGITLSVVREQQHEEDSDGPSQDKVPWWKLPGQIAGSIRHTWHYCRWDLRYIFFIQAFSWFGWFPLKYWSTTWINGLWRIQNPGAPKEATTGTRYGSGALLAQSLLTFGVLQVAEKKNERRSKQRADLACEDKPFDTKIEKDAERGELKDQYSFIALAGLWIWGNVFLAMLLLGSFIITESLNLALFVLVIVGASWAIASWVPFAMVGDLTHQFIEPGTIGAVAVKYAKAQEGEGRDGDIVVTDRDTGKTFVVPAVLKTGEIAGLHVSSIHVFIVLPQMASIFVSLGLSRWHTDGVVANMEGVGDKMNIGTLRWNNITIVLVLGGVAAIIAAALSYLTRARLIIKNRHTKRAAWFPLTEQREAALRRKWNRVDSLLFREKGKANFARASDKAHQAGFKASEAESRANKLTEQANRAKREASLAFQAAEYIKKGINPVTAEYRLDDLDDPELNVPLPRRPPLIIRFADHLPRWVPLYRRQVRAHRPTKKLAPPVLAPESSGSDDTGELSMASSGSSSSSRPTSVDDSTRRLIDKQGGAANSRLRSASWAPGHSPRRRRRSDLYSDSDSEWLDYDHGH